MTKKSKKASSYISEQERFSPSSIARDCAIELSTALELCSQFVSENPHITKWFQLNCPECGSYVRGMSVEERHRIEYASCEDCGADIHISDDNLDFYYLNRAKKKEEVPSRTGLEEYLNTPLWVLNEVEKSPSEKLLCSKDNFLWHISDLHLTPSPGLLGSGHSKTLYDTFFRLIGRRKNIEDDIIVISGDCTDDGSKKAEADFIAFLKKLINLGIKKDNIVFVPGNHDAWNGNWRAILALMSYLSSENGKFKKFHSYPKRKLPSIFSQFCDMPMNKITRTLNGKEIEFICINTSMPREMARGIFPTRIERLEMGDDKPIRMSIMHHHLIDDLSSTTLDLEDLKKKNAMRVYNAGLAVDYLVDNGIDISLHGHKHFQYHKLEHKINSQNKPVHLVSAPSLFENHFDEKNGNIKDDNFLGFNLLSIKEGKFDLFFYRLSSFDFKLKHHACLSI